MYPTPVSGKKRKRSIDIADMARTKKKLRFGRKRGRGRYKKGSKGVKNSSVTFQHDRGTEYRSKRLSGRAKSNLNFEKRVVKAIQKKLPPNYMLLSRASANLSVPTNTQGYFSAMLWSANGATNSSDDIAKIYSQIGGVTSATQGYAYDLMLHWGILEVDMCLETSSLQVAQGLVDVYTVKCRKDVNGGVDADTNAGTGNSLGYNFCREL